MKWEMLCCYIVSLSVLLSYLSLYTLTHMTHMNSIGELRHGVSSSIMKQLTSQKMMEK